MASLLIPMQQTTSMCVVCVCTWLRKAQNWLIDILTIFLSLEQQMKHLKGFAADQEWTTRHS